LRPSCHAGQRATQLRALPAGKPSAQPAMSTMPAGPLDSAKLYLRMLTEFAPAHTLLDVRYRIRGHELARFFVGVHAARAASMIVRIGQRTDVYVGCASRLRRRGRREDIVPTPMLWADCDGAAADAVLAAFQPPASMIVASGSGENVHAYWGLTHPLVADELEEANRRLAAGLGADPKCADPARVLRVPGTLNFKHGPPRRVHLRQYTGARYQLVEILRSLPSAPITPTQRDVRQAPTLGRASDPLLLIEPARYVRVLTGRQPARDGKISCPFHGDDNPSFHVYPRPEQGWACFGCPTPDGKPLGGDIYTLASMVWNLPTSGRDFLALRGRLDELFGVRRSGALGRTDQ
jgi:RepB DNA-primase N-terminal domain/CHC2 zinc finger